MKVIGINNQWQVYENKKITGAERLSKTPEKKDVFSLSDTAKDFQTALKAVYNTPDVRQDKIDAVSKRFNSDNYNVSSDDVADKILSSTLNIIM